jgi:hypothetical protein
MCPAGFESAIPASKWQHTHFAAIAELKQTTANFVYGLSKITRNDQNVTGV